MAVLAARKHLVNCDVHCLSFSLTSSIHGQEIVSRVQVNLQLVEWELVALADVPGACL